MLEQSTFGQLAVSDSFFVMNNESSVSYEKISDDRCRVMKPFLLGGGKASYQISEGCAVWIQAKVLEKPASSEDRPTTTAPVAEPKLFETTFDNLVIGGRFFVAGSRNTTPYVKISDTRCKAEPPEPRDSAELTYPISAKADVWIDVRMPLAPPAKEEVSQPSLAPGEWSRPFRELSIMSRFRFPVELTTYIKITAKAYIVEGDESYLGMPHVYECDPEVRVVRQ